MILIERCPHVGVRPQHLIKRWRSGLDGAGRLAPAWAPLRRPGKSLAYRLFAICEKKSGPTKPAL